MLEHPEQSYTIVTIGPSTSALLFCDKKGEAHVYIGNNHAIQHEADELRQANYTENSHLLKYIREARKLAHPHISHNAKHYDIEEVSEKGKITSYVVRSVHESHDKLTPNCITFTMEDKLIHSEEMYPKALRWLRNRASAFATILESEGMVADADFILNSYIHALESDERLQKFTKGDRGIQTVKQNMLF